MTTRCRLLNSSRQQWQQQQPLLWVLLLLLHRVDSRHLGTRPDGVGRLQAAAEVAWQCRLAPSTPPRLTLLLLLLLLLLQRLLQQQQQRVPLRLVIL